MDIIEKGLNVMDFMVLIFLMDNDILLVVFNLNMFGNILKVVCGDKIGIMIEGEK